MPKTALTRELSRTKTSTPHSPHLPLKRWGEVDDISKRAIFLASDDPSYTHGDLIRVDGGESLCRCSVRSAGRVALPRIGYLASSQRLTLSARDSIVSWPSAFLFASCPEAVGFRNRLPGEIIPASISCYLLSALHMPRGQALTLCFDITAQRPTSSSVAAEAVDLGRQSR